MGSDEDETTTARSPLSLAISALEHSPVTPTSAPRMFQPGELVARRYRVVRFIARGGMGEVYEVEDAVLQQRVALKTIRADLADDETLLGRFHSEIALARRVTHRNVCRLFDVGFHDGERGRATFLTMELLDGESLRKRLKRDGPMTTTIALPIVEQMAAGLEAAHSFGIIHRDFKSDNVMLVPQQEGPPRVVITDFGLARSQDSSSTLGQQSGEGHQLKGTPAYMAPEQLSNGVTGSASDIYALGIVMYEMMTGNLPFTGDNPMLAAIKRLTMPPTPPRRFQPKLDRRWEQVMLCCLQREPMDRFAHAADVARALVDHALPVAPSPRRFAALALVGALVLGGGGGLWWRHHRHAPALPARASFAALGMANASGRADVAWLGTALTELLSAEVAAQGSLTRVPAESVTALRRELPLPDRELPPETLARVRAALHADYVLGGSYRADGGQLRLDVVVQDARSGETIAQDSESGAEQSLPELVSRAGTELRRRMGLRDLSAADVEQARAALPSDTATTRLYAEGLARLRRLDALGARDSLQQAVAADPDFPLAHAALADAYRRLGQSEAETREARLAWDHAGSLPRDQQLLVEANLRVAKKEWPRAVELYRALYDFYPGSLDYGLRLAQVQIDAGQAKDALATVSELAREAPAAARDPRVDLAAARAAESLGDSAAEDRAAQAAAQKARALGSRELEAEALLDEGLAALTLGDRPRAQQRSSEAYQLFVETGNALSVAQALRIRGAVAWKASQLTDARALLIDAVARLQALGDGDDLGRALNALAGVESDLNHHDEAMRLYRQALPLFEAAANRYGVAMVHLNLGQQLHHAGDFTQAETEELQGLSGSRATGQQRTQAIALESLGSLYLDEGALQKAADTERDAVALATQIHDATTIAQTRAKLGVALGEMGDVAGATAALQQSIDELDKLGENWRAGDAEVRLARLYVTLGRIGDAERLARRADERQTRSKVDSGQAAALLGRVLAAAGKLPEARAAVDRALAREPDELRVQTAAAEVDLAERHPERAIERLHRAMQPPCGVPERLEAALVLARAELAAGMTREAKARLRSVAGEAKAKNFALVLRSAVSLR